MRKSIQHPARLLSLAFLAAILVGTALLILPVSVDRHHRRPAAGRSARLAKTGAPPETHGKTLADSAVRSKHGVTVVGIKRPRADFAYARPETVVNRGDLLIVAGATRLVEKFAALT